MSSWNMAFKSLGRRKIRTALTISGIVVGISMTFVLLSLVSGVDVQTTQLVRALGGADITIYNGTAIGRQQLLRGTVNSLNESLLDTAAQVDGVYAASPQLSFQGRINNTVAIINGIDPEIYTLVTGGLNVIEGSESLASSGKEVLLGKAIADSLDAGIGSYVDLTETQTESFRVVGIYETGTAFQDRGAYIILDEAQNLSERQGQVTAILVKCLDPNEVSAVSEAITKLIPDVRAVIPTAAVQQVSNVLNTVRMFFLSIGLVALSAGTFGAVNTMMTSISERTREIGTLKAIGARDSQILVIFLSEALLLGLIGGVVGLGAGVLLSKLFPILTTRLAGGGIAGILPGGAGNRVGVGIQPAILPSNIILCLSIGVVVGLLAGIYPAMRAARMRPVEALRHV